MRWFAWATLVLTVAVILWGAFVRATGSGAGCGGHWPLCNGEVLPPSPEAATLIEYTHRLTSGLAFLAVVVLLIWTRRVHPAGTPQRRFAWGALCFMITEALVGAALVVFGWVAENASLARAWVMAFHLLNTFILLGFLLLLAWTAGRAVTRHTAPPALRVWSWVVLGVLVVISVSGAVAALGDTLFPAMTLQEALQADFSAASHFLIRLRVLHPALALGGTLLVLYGAWALREQAAAKSAAGWVLLLAPLQVVLGLLNVVLLAPVWLQLVHLLAADLLWMAAVLAQAGLRYRVT
ncbi:MAG: hypothetical protein Kow00109_26080 [Acidobacteriota bacterium]